MKRWIIGFVVFILAMCMAGVVYLYGYGGLKQYSRVILVMNKMPEEEKKWAWEEFNGTDPRGAERGILAGSWMGRVWIWERSGLKSFAVDEYSVYSVFDGCSDEIRAKRNRGEKNAVVKSIYLNFDVWREKAKVGDYVAVYPARPGNGGTMGNLREIYTYNFWLFLKAGIDRQCAK